MKLLHRLLRATCIAVALFACEDARRHSAPDVDEEDISRLVTLSPHLAELVYAVGAGDLLVGVSAYTDYPQAAAKLPVVGDSFNLDLERLAMLQPDLLLAWDSGTPTHMVDKLRNSGFDVALITTTKLADIPQALRQIGELSGHTRQALEVATTFEDELRALGKRTVNAAPISVFYQIDARPLYTVNGEHYVSELIELCGGANIFADLGGVAPLVSVEAVLERDPEVIMASTDAGNYAFDEWRRWEALQANRYGNYFLMPADETGRATPRLLIAARAFCEALDEGRLNREKHPDD